MCPGQEDKGGQCSSYHTLCSCTIRDRMAGGESAPCRWQHRRSGEFWPDDADSSSLDLIKDL